MSTVENKVNHPKHYSNSIIPNIEPIDIINLMSNNSWNYLTALKYFFRYKYKGNSVEDLKKALFYLEYKNKKLSDDSEMVITAFLAFFETNHLVKDFLLAYLNSNCSFNFNDRVLTNLISKTKSEIITCLEKQNENK